MQRLANLLVISTPSGCNKTHTSQSARRVGPPALTVPLVALFQAYFEHCPVFVDAAAHGCSEKLPLVHDDAGPG